jgi:hypothetical protein
MPGVFIGSTSRDLQEYRKAAIEECNRLGLAPVAMEFFEAMGHGATKGSQLQLDKADMYVGIFAHRYGYIEESYDKSVTEIEFDYAGERGLERICFVVDSTFPWPPDSIDYANYPKLQEFKSRLDKSLIRAQFTTVDDFRARLLQALVEWQKRHQPEQSEPAPKPKPAAVPYLLAPPLPALLVGREDDRQKLLERLGVDNSDQRQQITVIRGWPGVGKTTLINALAYDERVKKAFPDGIVWANVGEKPDPSEQLQKWATHFGLHDATKTTKLEEITAELRTYLADKQVLLIVDDVWETVAAAPFKVGGNRCATLFTTRFQDVARELAPTPGHVYVLGPLSVEKGFDLLNQLAPTLAKTQPEKSRQLVADLEGLPLAIRVAGRLLESEAQMGWGIDDMLQAFSSGTSLMNEVAPDDRLDPTTGTIPTVSIVLKKSTDRLDEETRDRFAFLGAFAPKPATFDLNAMRGVWMIDDAQPTAKKLADRGLLEPLIGTGRFQMHAVLVMHARTLLEN